MATFPGFIDPTGDDCEEGGPATSESSRVGRRDSTVNFTQTRTNPQEQMISISEPVDLPSEASEQPGPSSAAPPKKNRSRDNGSSPQRNTTPTAHEEIKCSKF